MIAIAQQIAVLQSYALSAGQGLETTGDLDRVFLPLLAERPGCSGPSAAHSQGFSEALYRAESKRREHSNGARRYEKNVGRGLGGWIADGVQYSAGCVTGVVKAGGPWTCSH